jgi:hypothetical protein
VQKIRFGLTLDGERGWHARNALGCSTVGPLGLLSIMETQLGLTRTERSQAERVVQMRACLVAARGGPRFYEKSFDVDELGTAVAILAWRDQWREHGWDGSAPANAAARLQDMAAIDGLAKLSVCPGVGERLNAIADVLALRQPRFESVEHLEPFEELPLTWRRVLTRLRARWAPTTPTVPLGPAGSMLNALQAAVLQLKERRAGTKIPWRDDGSVRLVRAESTLAAAQWLAAQARSCPDESRVIVIEQTGATVDAALGSMDQPLVGSSESSAFRPTLQILPLALRLLWEPLDFKAVLQFLTHPVGPIPSFARRTLAEKIASSPGLGGDAWGDAIQDIEAHYGDDGARVVAEIEFWLESARFAATGPAPLDVVAARVARLAEFFEGKMADPDAGRRASWTMALQQATAVADAVGALQRQGMQGVERETLDRLVSQAAAGGSENRLLRAEAGAAYYVSGPSAVIESFEQVCWWHMAAIPLAPRYPWSPRELEQLRGIGVDLPQTGALLDAQARGWLHPILAARSQLTLMLPREGEELHPAWLTLGSLIEQPVITAIEGVLGDGATAPYCAAGVGVTAVPHRPLPRQRRWWQIPAGAIHGWERSASFTSLDQFFNNPYQWALNYPAQLKRSSLLDLPGDFQLLGTLAHGLVERLYDQVDAASWSAARVQEWFDHTILRIVQEEGAVLLMRGRRADLESFRMRLRVSLVALHECLQAAGAITIEPEKVLEGDTPLGSLRGSSDLLVTLKDGRQVIIDMKWAGNAKYRRKLREQTHTQLAIYARLVENNSSAWPAVAFFLLRQPELLTTADNVFPGVRAISTPGASTSQLWDRIMATWAWRRTQIEAGALEVVMDGLEPTDESVPPPGALAVEESDPRYNACLTLAGWDADA